ncbi:MAG: methyltransferase [Gemmatimonadota bacterium]
MTTVPLVAAERPSPGLFERISDVCYARRDALVGSASFQRWAARFPLTRFVARSRSRALFDLCAGFVYSQVLRACVELDLFAILVGQPQTAEAIARKTGMPLAPLERLIGAAIALRLLARRSSGRIGLGSLGAPLATNQALGALIEHHAMLYDDLRDPLLLLRRRANVATELGRYYPYATMGTSALGAAEGGEMDSARTHAYSALMSATSEPLITEVLDAYSFANARTVLDVGGGEGKFARAVAARWPHLSVTMFDLPQVAELAKAATARQGEDSDALPSIFIVGGNFHSDALPSGADVITLVRVLLDHGDETVLALLERVRAALAPGGRLLIVEPMAGVRGARTVGDAYFALYLFAMGQGRARTREELRAMCEAAGFRTSRSLSTHYPVSTGILVAET